MKHNYTETYCLQLAREEFYKKFDEIPFVSDIKIIPAAAPQTFGDFTALVQFKDNEHPIEFFIEVKSNGEKRYVKDFMSRVSNYYKGIHCVFMAPFISKESSDIMKNEGFSYMDLSGNCYILTNRIFFHVSGQPNKYIEKREKKNYLSKASSAASAIMRAMLDEVDKEWQVITLAQKSGKAIGTVSNVKSFLRERDWIKDKHNSFSVCNVREILYVWAKDYHKKDAHVYEFYSFDDVAEIEQEISEWSRKHNNSAVLGGFSAAARYAPTVRYKKVDVYIEQQYLKEFVKDLDLQPVNSGGNVSVIIPHDDTPCLYRKDIHDSIVTSPVQTVIDLLGNVGRGEEAAEAIIQKVYGEK